MRRLGRCLLVALTAGAAAGSWASAETLSVLTYNLWHGFWRTVDKERLVLPSEGEAARVRRYRLQLTGLRELEPDVVMAQEVHPLPWRARELARGLGHRETHQLVSCGLRLLHVGVPWRVRSGLVITARRQLDLERIAAPRVSGRLGFCSDWLGLQLEEARRALLARIRLADGRRLLLVTTHLHSSTEGGAARGERRLREVEAVLEAIDTARRDDPAIDGVVLGGDLNALAGSKPIERLLLAGYVDAARALGAEFATYDPWTNELAARMTRAGGGDPERSAPRRIDYLFVSETLAGSVRSIRRYAAPAVGGAGSGFDSDHFGVLLELDLGPSKKPI